jgi:hypothetical protein
MIMHHQGVVVTIRSNGGPQREFDHHRAGSDSFSTITLPFDSEYAIAFKFSDGRRRRLELSIDGTLITNSLIVSDGSVLERFLDSDKKFKFVTANHEAVADPTSSENGGIVVQLWEERGYIPPRIDPNLDSGRMKPQGMTKGGDSVLRSRRITEETQCAQNAAFGDFTLDSDSISDRGATVEGGTSGQSFGTTSWAGDAGFPLTFTFKLRGQVQQHGRRPNTCPSCARRVPRGSWYCPYCGVDIAILATMR